MAPCLSLRSPGMETGCVGMSCWQFVSTRRAAFSRAMANREALALRAMGHSYRSSLSYTSSFLGSKLPVALVFTTFRRERRVIGDSCRAYKQRTTASFFGVGAPEALLVGVVALIVFGPQGLAEAAKSLGRTLRAFQPTIRELADVSQELKSTLEKEIGLNEIKEELRRPVVPSRPLTPTSDFTPVDTPSSSNSAALPATLSATDAAQPASPSTTPLQALTDDAAWAIDPDIEQKRRAAAQMAWGVDAAAAPAPSASGASSQPGGAASVPVAALSTEELEKELARRKASQA